LAVAPTNFATTNWTYDALLTHPANDWALLDTFTTAFNDNATRGRLSVNQTNLAAWSAVLSGVIALNGDPKGRLIAPGTNFAAVAIEPVGLNGTNSSLLRIVNAINDVRSTNFAGSFRKMGDILAVPELTVKSPFLNVTNDTQATWGVNDSVCERIPQQISGLLALDPPRFLVFAYGQALKPAPRSIITSGAFFNLCTNYQVTAETATRTVFRIDGLNERPPNPRVVIEKFSALPPD